MSLDFIGALPLISLVSLSLVVLLIEALFRESEQVSYWVSLVGLIVCIVLSATSISNSGFAFSNMITVGGFGAFFSTLFLVAALLTIVLLRDYIKKEHKDFGEFYLLILFATTGMILMAIAADLIIIFLGLELMSICLYILAGFIRNRCVRNRIFALWYCFDLRSNRYDTSSTDRAEFWSSFFLAVFLERHRFTACRIFL